MEIQIVKTDFLTVYLLEELSLFKNVWSRNSYDMNNADFKISIQRWCEQVEKYQISKNMVDTRDFGFAIEPELQDWYNEEINTRCYKAGMRKMAFIVPEDMISGLSIEQIFDSQNQIAFKYFDDESDALEWLME